MATIKNYTNLEQSRKLAKILPLESADMYHFIDDIDKVYEVGFGYRKITADYYSKTKLEYIPCWSLAKLLDVIPKKINFGYENYSTFDLKPLENGKYLADYYDVSSVKDNPVDACYEVIIKLNELNLL